jgi:hypothetical protein
METPFKAIIFGDKFAKLNLQKCSTEYLFTYLGEKPSKKLKLLFLLSHPYMYIFTLSFLYICFCNQ